MATLIPFTKMHGIGNDYVYINCFEQEIKEPGKLAQAISDRHFGVGSDGLVLIMPSEHLDVRMRMFNADGTEAEMCGNASRCVAKYAVEHGLVQSDQFDLETGAGCKKIQIIRRDGQVWGATVDMGEPILEPAQIPLDPKFTTKAPAINLNLEVLGQNYLVNCVSMGNPHAVIFVDDVQGLNLPEIGPKFEHHPVFPKRTNTEFVKVIDKKHLEMRVWERGAGETWACGTGACAVGVAAVLTGRTERTLTITLRGGDLTIAWDQNNHVLMTGPATTVFTGNYFFEDA